MKRLATLRSLFPWERPRILTATFALGWFGVILAGTFLMMSYANAPGEAGSFPPQWPQSSATPRDPAKPTLVMFVHPQCPCSRASVGELALLMAQCHGRVNARVIFMQPEGMTTEWVESDTWKEAARIPGVTVHRDTAGREARLFGSETSGDTALYDSTGQLRFHGGITMSRGHSGGNVGRDTLQAMLAGNGSSQTTTPTFGCSLF